MADRGHNGHRYRRIWHALLVAPDYLVCWLCLQPIDQRLRHPHPRSKSLDMVVPFSKGGDPDDPGNYRPAHLGCNSGRRERSPEAYRAYLQAKAPAPADPSHTAATLTVLMGCPGAGKTTWLQANHAGRVVCSTERLRTDRTLSDSGLVAYLNSLRTRATRALDAGHDVIIDGCHTRQADRSRWLNLAHAHRASTHLVVLHTPLPDLLTAQHERTHPVPEGKVRAYHREMQRALQAVDREGWGLITRIHRGDPDPEPGVVVAARAWTSSDVP